MTPRAKPTPLVGRSMKALTDFAVSAHVPIRVVSESNAHEFWRLRQRRAKQQRGIVCAMLLRPLNMTKPGPRKPKSVKLVRIAARKLDSDNLQGAFKHVRDEIAALCGFDDRDESVEWIYEQKKPAPGEEQFGVWIKVQF